MTDIVCQNCKAKMLLIANDPTWYGQSTYWCSECGTSVIRKKGRYKRHKLKWHKPSYLFI